MQVSATSQSPADARQVVLDGALEQVPAAPATLQAWQSPVEPPPHALLQQTPSTQKPLWHSFAPEQASPLSSFLAQLVPLQ